MDAERLALQVGSAGEIDVRGTLPIASRSTLPCHDGRWGFVPGLAALACDGAGLCDRSRRALGNRCHDSNPRRRPFAFIVDNHSLMGAAQGSNHARRRINRSGCKATLR
jgi:hypothetical protein